MDVKQLRYFIAIAEQGSLSAAAARIGIAQPSLSQQVRGLEQELGVSLLVRSPRGVRLTQSGEELLLRARGIVAALDETREALRHSGGPPRGPVAFGLPSSVSMVLSVPLAETVRLALPQVRLRVAEAMSGFIQGWLEEGSLDLAILYDVQAVRHMQIRPLMSEELHFFSAPDAWPLPSPPGQPLALAELAALDLVLPSESHGLRAMIERYARAAGVVLTVAVEMDALAQIKTLVARGSGYTILAPAAAQDLVARGELVTAPIVEPVLRRPLYLVRSPGRPLTRATQEVERVTLEVIADLVKRGYWQAGPEPDSA